MDEFVRAAFVLEVLGTIIWVIFILDFEVKFMLAPRKIAYLKRNWLTAIVLTSIGLHYWPQKRKDVCCALFWRSMVSRCSAT